MFSSILYLVFQAVSLIRGAKKIIILVQLFLINLAYNDFQILISIPHLRMKWKP